LKLPSRRGFDERDSCFGQWARREFGFLLNDRPSRWSYVVIIVGEEQHWFGPAQAAEASDEVERAGCNEGTFVDCDQPVQRLAADFARPLRRSAKATSADDRTVQLPGGIRQPALDASHLQRL
jgi:hypothetical protein